MKLKKSVAGDQAKCLWECLENCLRLFEQIANIMLHYITVWSNLNNTHR